MQETHSSPKIAAKWKNEWGAEFIFSHGSSNSRGITILIRNGFDCTIHSCIVDPCGRYIILKATIKDKVCVLINIYAPNKDRDIIQFFKNILITLRSEDFDSEENIILGGDFNCPLNPIMDKQGGVMTPRKSVISCINYIQSELNLVDIWRIKHPNTKSFTWSQQSPNIQIIQIIYVIGF